ncbi:MAG TPA: ATP-binding protein, partial [Rhodanobacteraceae bacterium]
RKPQLIISAITVRRDGKDVSLPTSDRQLHLRWDDRDLRITAQALSYIDPKRNHYRFQLTGLDPDWVDTGTRGTRELAGLKSGHYVLHVEAAGPSDTWARLAVPISIDVDAPPWLRPWAWALYIVALLLAIFLVFTAWRRRLEQRHRFALIEEKRQLAEQASAAKTRFLADLGHEIRTPMTGVLGMTELLLDSTREPRQRSYVESIRHSGELLLKLVNDALDLARIEAGRFELDPAPFDPRTLLEDVRQLLHGQAVTKGLELTAHIDAAVPACLVGDRLRIQQILLNLAGNAIKFTQTGGVYLRAGWTDNGLALGVRDTGPGISAADHKRLFERFEQADSPARSSGTGLGLAICREFAALMGGRITLDSTLGQGCHFTVWLPLPVAASPARSTAEAATVATPAAAPTKAVARHILLVEDDATVAAVIKGMLENRGHHVVHAAESLEALSVMTNATFDLALFDLDLPGMDGFKLAELVRQRETGRRMPIGAITARSGGDEEQHARAAGMDGFARKPLTGDELARLVDQLTDKTAPRKNVE